MRCLLLLLLLISEPVFSQKIPTFDTPPKPVQTAITSVVGQLFNPESALYDNDEDDIEKKVAKVKSQLEPLLENNPEWVAWLITSKFENADYYYEEIIELRHSLTRYLGEILSGTEQLYQLASVSSPLEEEQFTLLELQGTAISVLGKIQAVYELEQLFEPLLGAESDTEFYNDELQVYLEQIADNQIMSILPQLQRLQSRYESSIEQASKGTIEYSLHTEEEINLLTVTRAALGDIEMLVTTIALSFDKWSNTHEFATAALQALVQQHGETEILRYLTVSDVPFTNRQNHYRILSVDHENMWVRNWALQRYIPLAVSNEDEAELIELLLICIDDENWHVQMTAAQQLIQMGQSVSPDLYKSFAAIETPLRAKYVLLYVLASLSEDVEPMMDAVKDAYVPLPTFITPQMRRSIIGEWGDKTEDKTDFRWLTEYLLITPVEVDLAKQAYPIEQRIEALVSAYKRNDIEVDRVLDYHGMAVQETTTFKVVKMVNDKTEISVIQDTGDDYIYIRVTEDDAGTGAMDEEPLGQLITAYFDQINISKLGPFALYERGVSMGYADMDTDPADIDAEVIILPSYGDMASNHDDAEKYRAITAKQGFIWPSSKQLAFLMPGLNISHYGEPSQMSVKDLLFYQEEY